MSLIAASDRTKSKVFLAHNWHVFKDIEVRVVGMRVTTETVASSVLLNYARSYPDARKAFITGSG